MTGPEASEVISEDGACPKAYFAERRGYDRGAVTGTGGAGA